MMSPSLRENLKTVLAGKRVLLGVSGSIAAFKACDIVRGLKDCGATVRVVLTESAEKFVTPLTLETLSGQPVLTSLWGGPLGTHHIDTARWADVVCVAPATASTIARLALGLANDLLSTELLAFTGPVLIAPAMNPAMYAHPAVQANIETLRARGTRLLGPTSGVTACGEEGLGRMLEPETIIEHIAETFYEKSNGRRAVITLGPTRSAIDPVRYLTNRSSGKMGAALAWAAARAGFSVTAICGPSEVPLPTNATIVRVETAREMFDAALEAWTKSHLFLAAAAVLDWDVANFSSRKLKKESGENPSLDFAKNPDILAEACRARRPGQFVVGFAAETDDALNSGLKKLSAKGCDAVFVNDVSKPEQGFEVDQNAGWWITKGEPKRPLELEPSSKVALATKIIALCRT